MSSSTNPKSQCHNSFPFADRVLQYIAVADIHLVSFDLFDTLIFRRLGSPKKVFAKAFAHTSTSHSWLGTAEEYVEARVYAEQNARKEQKGQETTLEELACWLPFDEEGRQALISAELVAETNYSFVLEEMESLVSQLVGMGMKVVFISDMYLSANQIRTTFLADYPNLNNIPLYVSSDFRKSKREGSLFKEVATIEEINPANWLHIGDHPRSDNSRALASGLRVLPFAGALDAMLIKRAESEVYAVEPDCQAARGIAASQSFCAEVPMAYELGAYVWGPILTAFADFVIDAAKAAGAKVIWGLMREAETFVPVIEQRIQQRCIEGITLAKCYVSRKSTFWPSLNTSEPDWLDRLFDVLVGSKGHSVRGYTVKDFYRDMMLEDDVLLINKADTLVRDSGGDFYDGENVLGLLRAKAQANVATLKEHIANEKATLCNYLHGLSTVPIEQTVTVDLGSGGTIQHHMEAALGTKFAANLLMYSSPRIHRFKSETRFLPFLGQHQSKSILQALKRSPEAIEPLLVGNVGSTKGYQKSTLGIEPIIGSMVEQNASSHRSFLQGVLNFSYWLHTLALPVPSAADILGVLGRFIQLPSKAEADLYLNVYHEDNFGATGVYPVISNSQIEQIERLGVMDAYMQFRSWYKWKLTKIHWPQGVISSIEPLFLFRHVGLIVSNTDMLAETLVERLLDLNWKEFCAYGAGLFFEAAEPLMKSQRIEVSGLVDKMAGLKGEYDYKQYRVTDIKTALLAGHRRFVIFSFAFKDDIAEIIQRTADEMAVSPIDIVSL